MTVISSISLSGGQGKTSTCYFLGLILGKLGYKTLLIDCEPQRNLTIYSGIDLEENDPTLLEILNKTISIEDGIYLTDHQNVAIIPADRALENARSYLASTGTAATLLRTRIKPIKNEFDYILIDSPPKQDNFVLAVVGAAEKVIIPCAVSSKGLISLQDTLSLISKQRDNDAFEGEVLGVLPYFDEWYGLNRGKECQKSFEAISSYLESENQDQDEHITLFPTIRQSTQYKTAMNRGKTLRSLNLPQLDYPFEQVINQLTNKEHKYE